MIVANFSEFRSELKKYLDRVEEDNEILILKRSKGKGAVMLSMEEYNSLMETIHLLKSRSNANRLFESIQQADEEKFAPEFSISDL
jgi:antitoxin YefM